MYGARAPALPPGRVGLARRGRFDRKSHIAFYWVGYILPTGLFFICIFFPPPSPIVFFSPRTGRFFFPYPGPHFLHRPTAFHTHTYTSVHAVSSCIYDTRRPSFEYNPKGRFCQTSTLRPLGLRAPSVRRRIRSPANASTILYRVIVSFPSKMSTKRRESNKLNSGALVSDGGKTISRRTV